MKLNPDKCHMLLSDKDHNLNFSPGNDIRISGIHLDNKLDFNIHVTKLCS